MRCCWSYRRDSISWVSSPLETPQLGDLLSVAASCCEYPAHGFIMRQIHLMLGQLANLFQTTAVHVVQPSAALCTELVGHYRRRPKQLLQTVFDMVLKSSQRSVPDVLRSLSNAVESCSVVQNMYKEVVQRYLMRLRVEFEAARCVSVCTDKSKVAGGLGYEPTYLFKPFFAEPCLPRFDLFCYILCLFCPVVLLSLMFCSILFRFSLSCAVLLCAKGRADGRADVALRCVGLEPCIVGRLGFSAR